MNISSINIYILFFIIITIIFAIILYRIVEPKTASNPVTTITKSITVEGFSLDNIFGTSDTVNTVTGATAATLTLPSVSATPPAPPPFTEPSYNAGMEDASWDLYTQTKTISEMNQLQLGPLDSFCNSYVGGVATNKGCEQLTGANCKKVGCCVYTNSNKCVAGSATGPIYPQTDQVDYYYYKNKCYGTGCPPF